MSLVRRLGPVIAWMTLWTWLATARAQAPSSLPPATLERLPPAGELSLTQAPLPEPVEPGNLVFPPSSPPRDFWTHWGGLARGYYLNDQRLEFTGAEATFAVEGVVDGGVHQRVGNWDCMVEGQFFLNQPFERNILVDIPLRQSFAHNFDINTFEISQLYLAARNENLFFQAGRFVTPFGRFYFPMYLNNFQDSPFIRSEVVAFRETGFLAQWTPGPLVFTAALTNGGFQQDMNSSKALIARVGVDQGWYAFGASIKQQDGTGSEMQKLYNNHVGVDAMVRFGNWTLSGEALYDEFGFRRPGFNLDDITWGRSLYFREVNRGLFVPSTGVGYYVNLGYQGPRWMLMLNYGDYFPRQQLGIPARDTPIHRGIVKLSYHFTPNLETYGIALIENDVSLGVGNLVRKGSEVIAGWQWSI